jgi:autotransporter-associated beta strand protein
VLLRSSAVSTVYATNGILDVQNGGTVTFQSSAATTFVVPSVLATGWQGGTGTITILGNTTTVNVGAWMGVARDVSSSTGTVVVGAANGSDAPTLNVGQFLDVGYFGTGNMTINGGSHVNVAGGMNIADGGNGVGSDGVGNVTLNGNSSLTAGSDILMAVYGGTGTLVVNGTSHVSTATNLQVGYGWGSDPVADQGVGIVKVNGGQVNAAGWIILGASGSQGSWTQTAGTTTCGGFCVGQWDNFYATSTGSGTLTLSGGTLITSQVRPDSDLSVTYGALSLGHGTVILNGGILQASADNLTGFINTQGVGDTMNVYASTGGALIDTAGHTVLQTLPFQHDPALGSSLDGGLTKLGAGVLTLSGVNTYTGLTSVNAGTLALGVDNAISTAVAVNGGTLDVGGFNATVGTVTLNSGAITGTTGVLTSTADFAVKSGSVSAILNGAVGLTKTTAGIVTLSGVNTYTGLTSVNAGTLALGGNNAISAAVAVNGGTFDVNSHNATVGAVTLNSGAITGTTGLLTSTAGFTVNSGSASAILAGAVGLTKTTSGTVTLTGANTYSGTTIVNQGTLQLSGPNARNPVMSLGGANVENDWTKLVFNYTGETGSPASAIAAQLALSYNHGWAGASAGKIFSTTCAASSGSNARVLGMSDNGTQVTVMQTVPGDATLDGTCNLADLTLVLTHYNHSGTWSTGDVNYDGSVNLADLNIVLTHYNHGMPALGDVVSGAGLDPKAINALTSDGFKVVPEPGTLALLAAGLIGLLAYAWRKRK